MSYKSQKKTDLLRIFLTGSFLVIYMSAFYIFLFMLNIAPAGSDWPFYSTLRNIQFSETTFYFQREFFSWWLIGQINSIFNGSSYAISILIHLLLTISTLILAYSRSGNFGYLALLLLPLFFSNFYVLMSVNGLRQGIGLIFFLLYLSILINKKILLAFIFLLLAIFSHNSFLLFAPIAIFFLPIHAFYKQGLIASIFLILFLFQDMALAVADRAVGRVSPNNYSMFFIVIMFGFLFSLFFINAKFKKINSEELYSALYFCLVPIPFFTDNSLFERICYTSIPLLYIMLMKELSKLRFHISSLGIICFLVLLLLIYFFTNSSIQNNFSAP